MRHSVDNFFRSIQSTLFIAGTDNNNDDAVSPGLITLTTLKHSASPGASPGLITVTNNTNHNASPGLITLTINSNLTWPPVSLATAPSSTSLQSVPAIVNTDTVTLHTFRSKHSSHNKQQTNINTSTASLQTATLINILTQHGTY